MSERPAAPSGTSPYAASGGGVVVEHVYGATEPFGTPHGHEYPEQQWRRR
jgi:hypothetical protein